MQIRVYDYSTVIKYIEYKKNETYVHKLLEQPIDGEHFFDDFEDWLKTEEHRQMRVLGITEDEMNWRC